MGRRRGGGEGSKEEGKERVGRVADEVRADMLTANGDDVTLKRERAVLIKETLVEAAIAEVRGGVGGAWGADTCVPENLAVVSNDLEKD